MFVKRKKIAVFVPLYNEGEVIASQLEAILKVAEGRIDALLVVDDGSEDDSAAIASRYTTHVLRLQSNSGNGFATRAALKYIAALADDWSYVVRIDGDGQHDPNLLPAMFAALDEGEDVVVCSRFHVDSDTRTAMLDRFFLNEAMAHLTSRVTGWPVTDARSGFLGFRWKALRPVIGDLRVERYGIPIELLLRTWHANPQARFREIAHPAKYDTGISARLDGKYGTETMNQKVSRMTEAYGVLLATCASLGVAGAGLRRAA